MNTTLRLRPVALALALAGSIATLATTKAQAQSATTDPVGYYTVTMAANSDTVLSLPMIRDAVFAGTVASGAGNITASGFTALAGSSSPGWTAHQWQYNSASQHLTYYAEFTSGALKGLYYKIVDNDASTLTLDTEGDSLLSHPLSGNPTAALAAGDSFKIRPYWRIRDVFESNGTPIIQPRPDFDTPKDDILMPNYTTVAQNKAANVTYYYLSSAVDGTGWRSVGSEPADKGDDILRPNEAIVFRRRSATPLTLTNLGNVEMIRAISFIPGGNGTKGNDTYVSLARPAAVSLNQSGLHNTDQSLSVIKDSVDPDNPGDKLLVFSGTGFNRAPNKTYYYLAGAGWRLFPDLDTDVGGDLLQPGVAFIVRKVAANAGRDWINDPNY